MSVWNSAQKLLPHHAISRTVGGIARIGWSWFSRPLMRFFVRAYKVDMSDSAQPDLRSYVSFNDLFTRALRDDARPQDPDPAALTSPVDGTISEFGPIRAGRLTQAKGRDYSLAALLGHDEALARTYRDGEFITIYLAPYNYHRMHMPSGGRRTRMTLVPGRLFSVNASTAAGIDNLFARNERVACHFDGEKGNFCMVLVGALNVGSIATTWHGNVTPPRSKNVCNWTYEDADNMPRGAEMGRFNLGSTVILLVPPKQAQLAPSLAIGQTLRVGQRIGAWQNP